MINNFVVLESIYGKFIVARTCHFQADALVKTGHTHIEAELNNIFAIVDTLPRDAIIIDGGANIGFFSVPVSQRAPDARIIAFEPQRQLFNALSGTLALNDISNCFLHNLGLSDCITTAQLPVIDYGVDQDFGMVQLINDDTIVEQSYMRTRDVDIITIDSMQLPRLDFIKLDVEGYECPALVGGLKTITQYRPWIWVEYFITGADAIKQTLDPLIDYDYYIVDYQNMLCVPKERALAVTLTDLRKV